MDLHTKIDENIIMEDEFNTDSLLHANVVDVLNEVKTDNVIDINRTDLDLNTMFLEFCDKESTTESDLENLQSLPGISYIIIFTGGTKKNYVTFDCVLCNPHYGRILSGRVMTKHLRSKSHLLNTLKLHSYSLYEKYRDSATETHSELAGEVYNCESNSKKHIIIVTAKNYSEERRKLSSVVTQLYEKCKKLHVRTTPIFDYCQSSNDAKTSVTSEGSFSPCINYSLNSNHLTVAEKLAINAKSRHPKQIVVVLDREDLPLEIKKFGDVVKVVKITNLKFSNAIENLQKYKIIGNGSHIIILCGIYSLISASVAEICKKQKCLNPINKYTVNPSISCDDLVSKALTVHEYVLNNTSHDQVTFCDIVPINISNRVVKTCASKHSIQYDTLQEIYINYLNIIDEYNSFIDIHCQIFGIKNLNLLDILFPVESNNIIRPLDYLYDCNQVDKENAAQSLNKYISELLKGMGIEIQATAEAIPKSQPKDMKLKGLQNILKKASKKLASSKSKSLWINSSSLPSATPSNVELGDLPEIETTLFSPAFANLTDSVKSKRSHALYTTNTISATSDSSAALEASSSVMPHSAVSEELLSQSKGDLFDQIIIVTNPEYLSCMKKLTRPGVTVACAASGGLDQISYTIKRQRHYESARHRILWLTHTEVFKVFRNEMSTMCASCSKPLEVQVPIMLTSSPSNFVNEIQNSFDELTKKISSFFNRNYSFAVLPPIPPSFLVLEKDEHILYHKIFSEKKVKCYLTTSEALAEFERMFSELRKQMIPFTLSKLAKLNIEHCMTGYSRMVNTWSSYLDVVTCDNFLNSNEFVGEKYSKWFQYVNKLLSDCLKSEGFENISGKSLWHQEINSSEMQAEEKNFISKTSNITPSNQENNANLRSVFPDAVVFAESHSSSDKGHYEHFVFICFSLEHAELIAQEKLNAKNIYTVILDNSMCWTKAKEEIDAVVTSDMKNILFIIMGTMAFLAGSFREFCSKHKIIPSSGEGLRLINPWNIAYMAMAKVRIFISRLRSHFIDRSHFVLTPLFFTKRIFRPVRICSYIQNIRAPLCTHLRTLWNQKMLQLLHEQSGKMLNEMNFEKEIEYTSTFMVYWDENADTFVTLSSNYDMYCRSILRKFIAAFSDDTCESSEISIQSNLNEQTSQEIAHDTKMVSQEIKNESQKDDYDSQSRDSKLAATGNNTPQDGDYHTNSNTSTVVSTKFPDASHSVSDFYSNKWNDLVIFGLQTVLQYLVEAINGLKTLSHQKAKVLCIGSSSSIINEIKDHVSKILSSLGESGVKLVVLENTSDFSVQFDCLLTTPADLMNVTGSWNLLGIVDVRAVIVYDVMKILKKSMSKRSLITIIDRMELKKNTAINKIFASESYQSGLKYCLTSLFQISLQEIKDSPWLLKEENVNLGAPQMTLDMCKKDTAYQIKILVEHHFASNIIGPRGENVETLERDTNSRIKILRKCQYFPGTSQQLCWITGTVDEMLKALFSIIEIKRSMFPRGSEIKMEFVVPDSTARLISGEKEENIQQIMIKSKANIQMYQKKDFPSPDQACFAVKSYDVDFIKTAFSLILEYIVRDPENGTGCNISNPNASLPSSFYEALNTNEDSPWLLKNEIVNLETCEKYNSCQIKMLLENDVVGKVIGPRGDNREKLEIDANCRINISKRSEYFPGTSLRVCLIAGTSDAVMKVVSFIIDYKRLIFPRGSEIKMEFAVPDSTARRISGEKEQNIKQIMIKSKAYIQMYQKKDFPSPDESCFVVKSFDEEFIKKAFLWILACIGRDPENGTRSSRSNPNASLPSSFYEALNTNEDQSDKTTSDVSLNQELSEQNNKDVRYTELNRQVSESYSSPTSNQIFIGCPVSSNQTTRGQLTVNASIERGYFTEDRNSAVDDSHVSGYQTFSNQLISQYQGTSHCQSRVYPSTSNQSYSDYRPDEYSSVSSNVVSGYSGSSYQKDVSNPYLSSHSSSEYSVMGSGYSTFSKETSMYQSIYSSNSPSSFTCRKTTPDYQKSPTRESHSRSRISSTRRKRSRSHSPRKRPHSRSRDREYYRSHDRDHSPFLRDERTHSRSRSGDYSEYQNKRTRTKYSDSKSRSSSNSRDENQFRFDGKRSDRFHVSRSQSRSNPKATSPYSKSIDNNFSVLGALNFLDRACDKIGELGRMAKSVITSIKSELEVDRKKALHLMKEKSNIALFKMVIDNLDSILPSSSLTEVSDISQAIDWTRQLIEYCKKEGGIIDFEALAAASMNKTSEVTFQLIKSAYAYEGKFNPTDEELNEAILQVSYLQCKMALKED